MVHIWCGRRYLRGVAPSKILLLREVIRDDNAANNGGILIILDPLITVIASVQKSQYNLLEDQKIIKTIPWEVDLILI